MPWENTSSGSSFSDIVAILQLRPDLEYVPIRGNIQTRLSKLEELDGVVLAAAGLKRMGLEGQVTEYFSTEQMLPASGQGILAIETLSSVGHCGDSPKQSLADILSRVNDADTNCIAVAEMAYLKALNAGCQFPVASFAEFADDCRTLKIRGIYWDEGSQRLIRAAAESTSGFDAESLEERIQNARALGIRLAERIRESI